MELYRHSGFFRRSLRIKRVAFCETLRHEHFYRLLTAVLAGAYLSVLSSRGGETSFVVSPEGDDTNPGNEAAPFATVVRAQQAIRQLKAGGTLREPVTVNLRAGVYPQPVPLVFTPEDSGTDRCPVTYRSYPGETAVISGGRRVTGFAKSGKFWTVTLNDVKAGAWVFNQLYINGHRRSRARTPNDGLYFRVHSAFDEAPDSFRGFRFAAGDVQEWRNLDDAMFVVYGSWYNTIHHVKELDLENRTVWFTNSAGRPFSWYEKNLRYYVENVFEALDAPGEWYLDRTTGVLTYYPLPGEEPGALNVVAPAVRQTLVRFQGAPGRDRYVEHVRFQTLQFRHTDAYLPKDLYDGRQAATVQDAGILADGARHCVIEDCEVANMGEHGIWFRDDCHHNLIRRCHVHDLGGGGVYIGEKWRWDNACPGWPGYKKHEDIPHTTEHNVVDNCFVHDGCYLFTGAMGIWIGQASYTTISHNDICDLSYSGISAGWDWAAHRSTAHHNVIEYNRIHHIGHRRMNDLAGIYTLGLSPGTVLRFNLIHDVEAYQSAVGYCLGAGIYLDQSSGDLVIENNVCYNIDNTGFFLHYGANNRVANNVFAGLRGLGPLGWGMYACARGDQADKGNMISRNIVWAETGKLAKATLTASKAEAEAPYEFVTVDRNLYYTGSETQATFSVSAQDSLDGIIALTEWRKHGYDVRSLVSDPLFVAPAVHDYRLKPESPAHALGIISIDPSTAGLYGDESWVELPRQIQFRAPDTAAPFVPRQSLILNEDYEDKTVGYVPSHVQFTDKAKGAVIQVTDERAADGAKSLKFVDVPGLEQPYHPNRVWSSLHVPSGRVKLSFDCMNGPEKPATFLVELRDWTKKQYGVGPALSFSPEGKLAVGGERRMPCESGRWYHTEISFQLGEGVPATYTFSFTLKGEPLAPCTVPFVGSDFKTLTWLGFIAMDDDRHAEFFIDNLRIDMD